MDEPKLLISLEDFKPYKFLTKNLSTVKNLDPFINEAQEFDLKQLLGRELFIDILEDYPDLNTYADLYNGKSYTYSGKKYRHYGLKPLLVYFTYARYLPGSNAHSTEYGMMKKKSEDSEPISDAEIARQISQAREGALSYWQDVKFFLNHYASTYTLWKCSGNDSSLTGIPQFRGIG